MGFSTEAHSGVVAVMGVVLFSSCANFLLSSEISFAGKLTRSLFPYLNTFTKLLPSVFRTSALLAGLFKVAGGQEKNSQRCRSMYASTCSLAGQHHCTCAVSMETRIKILNNGN